jgi:hypothetical protein
MPYSPRIVNLNGATTYHDEVRARLGVTLATLPDTDIDAPSVLPVAEGMVVSRVPDYATLTTDNQSFVYAACICMIGAVLAPSMAARIKASEGDSDYKYTNQAVAWEERKRDLTAEAYSLMDLISTQVTVELPQAGVAGPTRYAQQQIIDQGGSTDVFPDSGDVFLYPTDVE